MDVVALVALLLQGLMAGMFLCSAMVEHAVRGIGGAEWFAYKMGKERVFGAVMPGLFGGTLLITIVAAVVAPLRSGEVAAAVLLAGAQAITMLVHLPLNRLFTGWTAATLPPEWPAARRRWQAWNWARCACAVAAFVAVVVALGWNGPVWARSSPLMPSTSSTSASDQAVAQSCPSRLHVDRAAPSTSSTLRSGAARAGAPLEVI